MFPEGEKYDKNQKSLQAIAIYYLLLNGNVPLNLTVVTVLVKFVYVGYLVIDYHMVSESKSLEYGEVVGCKVKNLELVQDLSMVNNLFCDKTGTLTKNLLKFSGLVFNGKLFKNDGGNFEDFRNMIRKQFELG